MYFMYKTGENQIISIEQLQFMNMPNLEDLFLGSNFDKWDMNKIIEVRAFNKCLWNSLKRLSLCSALIYQQFKTQSNKFKFKGLKLQSTFRIKKKQLNCSLTILLKVLICLQSWLSIVSTGKTYLQTKDNLDSIHAWKENISSFNDIFLIIIYEKTNQYSFKNMILSFDWQYFGKNNSLV